MRKLKGLTYFNSMNEEIGKFGTGSRLFNAAGAYKDNLAAIAYKAKLVPAIIQSEH
jgi:hypothetical protein